MSDTVPAYSREELEAFVEEGPTGRKKLVEILRDECGFRMAEIVALPKGEDRVAAILDYIKSKSGGKVTKTAAKTAPAAGKTAAKTAAKKEPEPEPEEESMGGGVSAETFNAAIEGLAAKQAEILEALGALSTVAERNGAMLKLSLQLGGMSEEDIEESLGN